MSNYYNLDGVRTYLEKELEHDECLLTAWKSVTLNTKKDGSPFATMSKNFNGATYKTERWASYAHEKELSVTAWSKMSGYVTDSIRCYELLHCMDSSSPLRNKKQNIIDYTVYGVVNQTYVYDMSDITNAIEKRIAYYSKSIETLKAQLEVVDSAYNNFKEAMDTAVKNLKTECNYDADTRCYYAIKDTVLHYV